MRVSKKSLIAGVAVAASALAGTVVAGAGDASAAVGKLVDMSCVGLSPNVIDMPYSAQVIVDPTYDAPAGTASFTIRGNSSLWGYGTHPTLTWTNLATGASGSLTGHGQATLGNGSTVYFSHIPTGTGPLRVDLSVTNTGWFPIPAINCSGTSSLD
ncbi:hypothetical protein ACWDOP_34680 [Nocardia sp. NPDC003693]